MQATVYPNLNRSGLCGCGCGGATTVATRNNKFQQQFKGQPAEFIHGHNARIQVLTTEHKQKISRAHIGKKVSLATRQKLSAIFTGHPSLTGPANHGWKGGVAAERRDMVRMQLWARAVKRRDNYTCQECGYRATRGQHAHHVKSYAEFPELRHDVANGVTLCVSCHKDAHRASRISNSGVLESAI